MIKDLLGDQDILSLAKRILSMKDNSPERDALFLDFMSRIRERVIADAHDVDEGKPLPPYYFYKLDGKRLVNEASYWSEFFASNYGVYEDAEEPVILALKERIDKEISNTPLRDELVLEFRQILYGIIERTAMRHKDDEESVYYGVDSESLLLDDEVDDAMMNVYDVPESLSEIDIEINKENIANRWLDSGEVPHPENLSEVYQEEFSDFAIQQATYLYWKTPYKYCLAYKDGSLLDIIRSYNSPDVIKNAEITRQRYFDLLLKRGYSRIQAEIIADEYYNNEYFPP